MLVKGQTLMGTISPSYVCMMEFVVAAQGIIKETLCAALQGSNLGNTPPHKYNKIKELINIISSGLCYFWVTKSNQKSLGEYCQRAINQTAEAAAKLTRDQGARRKPRKEICASRLVDCCFRCQHNAQTHFKCGVAEAGRRLLW